MKQISLAHISLRNQLAKTKTCTFSENVQEIKEQYDHEKQLLPIYMYTIDQLKDFWFNSDGMNVCEFGEVFKIISSSPEFLDVIKQEPSKFINKLLGYISSDLESGNIYNIIWWFNAFLISEHEYVLIEDKPENYQWYFNKPEHPFEKFLVNDMSPVNPYVIFETELQLVNINYN